MTGTGHDTPDIPLLNKLSRKALKRQKAQDCTHVNFNVPPTSDGAKQTSRSSSYMRSDSINDRYARAGDTANVRKYTLPLLQAAAEGDHDRCKQELEIPGVNINMTDEETGYTALHIAAKKNHYDIIHLLLEKGADCNAQDTTEQTPLHLAVKKDHVFCCQIFLGCPDLKVNLHNKTYDTSLHYAAKEGRYSICKMLIEHPDTKVNVKNKKGMTPLHYAAQENQSEILKLLLDNNADWKKQDNHAYLALHYAAQKGYENCCRVLISDRSEEERAKQMRTCLKDGKTPLILAAKGGHHRCCEIMEYRNLKARDKEGNSALHYAAMGGYDYTVTQLLDKGADPNTQNKKGSAPVLEAAGKKKFGCLKILAEKGAVLDVFDKQGKSVLHHAAEKNAVETIKYLLNFSTLRSIMDRKDINLCSPLHLAIKKEADESALLLLENEASPTEPCGGGLTPLHLAADKGSTSICEVLLSKKEVQVSQENDSKATPLHMAAFHGSLDVCQMLIRKGARITAIDNKGRTALHVASVEGYANVVKFLVKKGLPLKLRDDTGSCALHLAASKGSLECCQILVSAAKATCWELDQNGDLPLDRAFKETDEKTKITNEDIERHDQVFKYLLINLCLKSNPDRQRRIHLYMDNALKHGRVAVIEAIADSCWWEDGISGGDVHQCQNFRLLIKSYPCIALKIQDKCIKRSKENCSKVTYDFRLFEDNYYIPPGDKPSSKSPFDPKTHKVVSNAIPYTNDGLEWKRNHPLTLMIAHQRPQLLHHSLVKTWLWHKWKSYIYKIFLLRLLIEILFTIFLSLFMGTSDNWMHIQERCNLTDSNVSLGDFCTFMDNRLAKPSSGLEDVTYSLRNSTESENVSTLVDLEPNIQTFLNLDLDTQSCFERYTENLLWKRILWSILLALTSIILLLELNYMFRLKKQYFFLADHCLQVLRIITTLVILVPVTACEFNYIILRVGSWQCGIIALLLTWLHLINTLNQLPMLSVFMPVTLSFAKSFLKVVFYIVMIIFVFAFIFHLLLQDQAAFSTVPQAMVKTIVWMLGDLAYDDTFLTDEHALYYPIMVNMLFVVFVTILGGFIANLVITQPANKLDDFRDKALFHRAASRTELFLKLDVCFPFFCKERTVGSYVDDESKKIDYSFFTKKLLMLDNKDEFQPEETNPLQRQLEDLNKQFVTIQTQFLEQREEVRDIKHQLNSIIKLIEQKK